MKLLIVESATKAKTLAKVLDPSWRVKASLGHICDLPKREMGIDPQTYALTYELSPKGKDIVKSLRDEVARADEVYLGTDPDREGEAIAWHLRDALKLRNPKRVMIHELTAAGAREAIANAGAIDENLFRAQEVRRALDRLVGYRVSPQLSDMIGQPGLSAGRVQTPALRLVVDREREIRNFVSQQHFGVTLSFDGDWTAEWDFSSLLPQGEKIWLSGDDAAAVAAVRDVVVVSCNNETARSAPPPAFETATMQQAASVKLKIDPDETMRLAQSLFEAGHITYHRTDDVRLKTSTIEAIRDLAQRNRWALPDAPRTFKASADSQEAHEGIRPTQIDLEEAGSTEQERALYRLIRLRAIASQLADAEYDVRTAVLRSAKPALRGAAVEFVGRGRTLMKLGWKTLTSGDATDEDGGEDAAPDNPVPALHAGDALAAIAGERKAKQTTPPGAFTDAAIVKELKRRGIGRPATYASILSVLHKRNYVIKDKARKLHPAQIGEVVRDALVGRFAFGDYDFTKIMESSIDKVASGKMQYFQLVSTYNRVLDQELAQLAAANVPRVAREGPKCPVCTVGYLVKRDSKFGKFHSCDAFRSNGCQARFRDARGKPDLNSPIVARVIPDDAPACPKCQKGKLVARNGARGVFYGCTEFRMKSGKPSGCDAMFDSLPAQQAEVA